MQVKTIDLTPDFRRDLRWFWKLLPLYNDISLYDHRQTDFTLELYAYLTGLGARWSNLVYHLTISVWLHALVHCSPALEIVNILLAVRLFQAQWTGRRVLIRCDS